MDQQKNVVEEVAESATTQPGTVEGFQEFMGEVIEDVRADIKQGSGTEDDVETANVVVTEGMKGFMDEVFDNCRKDLAEREAAGEDVTGVTATMDDLINDMASIETELGNASPEEQLNLARLAELNGRLQKGIAQAQALGQLGKGLKDGEGPEVDGVPVGMDTTTKIPTTVKELRAMKKEMGETYGYGSNRNKDKGSEYKEKRPTFQGIPHASELDMVAARLLGRHLRINELVTPYDGVFQNTAPENVIVTEVNAKVMSKLRRKRDVAKNMSKKTHGKHSRENMVFAKCPVIVPNILVKGQKHLRFNNWFDLQKKVKRGDIKIPVFDPETGVNRCTKCGRPLPIGKSVCPEYKLFKCEEPYSGQQPETAQGAE